MRDTSVQEILCPEVRVKFTSFLFYNNYGYILHNSSYVKWLIGKSYKCHLWLRALYCDGESSSLILSLPLSHNTSANSNHVYIRTNYIIINYTHLQLFYPNEAVRTEVLYIFVPYVFFFFSFQDKHVNWSIKYLSQNDRSIT